LETFGDLILTEELMDEKKEEKLKRCGRSYLE
jgi:hypothetical protein